jgi:hypothetical protein
LDLVDDAEHEVRVQVPRAEIDDSDVGPNTGGHKRAEVTIMREHDHSTLCGVLENVSIGSAWRQDLGGSRNGKIPVA